MELKQPETQLWEDSRYEYIPRLPRLLSIKKGAAPDWECTYRSMVLYVLAVDMGLGCFLASYRNFAVPSIASTPQRNGEIIEHPMKRSYDTLLSPTRSSPVA